MLNSVSDNIVDVVDESVNVDKGSFHNNNGVHVGSSPGNEGITKDIGLSKRSDKKSKKKVENRKVILKDKRTPYKKIPTPTKKNNTSNKKNEYVVGSKE